MRSIVPDSLRYIKDYTTFLIVRVPCGFFQTCLFSAVHGILQVHKRSLIFPMVPSLPKFSMVSKDLWVPEKFALLSQGPHVPPKGLTQFLLLTVRIHLEHGCLCSRQFTLLSLTISYTSSNDQGVNNIPITLLLYFCVHCGFPHLPMFSKFFNTFPCSQSSPYFPVPHIMFPTLPRIPKCPQRSLWFALRLQGSPSCITMNIPKTYCSSESSKRFSTPAHVFGWFQHSPKFTGVHPSMSIMCSKLCQFPKCSQHSPWLPHFSMATAVPNSPQASSCFQKLCVFLTVSFTSPGFFYASAGSLGFTTVLHDSCTSPCSMWLPPPLKVSKGPLEFLMVFCMSPCSLGFPTPS